MFETEPFLKMGASFMEAKSRCGLSGMRLVTGNGRLMYQQHLDSLMTVITYHKLPLVMRLISSIRFQGKGRGVEVTKVRTE